MQAVIPFTLKQRVLRAGTWMIGGNFVSQALRLASSLIVTRLLVPEMFGVMALANVLMIGMQMLSDLGLKQNIIQSRQGGSTAFLNTAWTVQIVRGAAICLLTLIAAAAIYGANAFHLAPANSVYSDRHLPWVVGVLSLNALITGFESTKWATANRNLALGRIITLDLFCNFAGAALMVGWAWLDRSIWALVFGTLFTSALRMSLSHLALPGDPNRLCWDNKSLHEILHFGKWVFLSSILGFLASSGDRLLLGGLVGTETLGVYSIAFMMVGAVQGILVQIGGSVAFPALSEVVRERREELRRVYYRLRQPLDIVTLLSMGGFFALGELLIQLLYDDRYLQAGHMIEILCIGLFEVRYTVANQCFMALGMPKLLSPIIALRLLALFGLMPLSFAWWGLDGALWIAGGSALFTLPVIFYFKIKHSLFDLKRELVVLPLIGIGFAVGYLVDLAVRHLWLI